MIIPISGILITNIEILRQRSLTIYIYILYEISNEKSSYVKLLWIFSIFSNFSNFLFKLIILCIAFKSSTLNSHILSFSKLDSLDGFANIGEIPDFNKEISTVRSRGIALIPIVQNTGKNKNKTIFLLYNVTIYCIILEKILYREGKIYATN